VKQLVRLRFSESRSGILTSSACTGKSCRAHQLASPLGRPTVRFCVCFTQTCKCHKSVVLICSLLKNIDRRKEKRHLEECKAYPSGSEKHKKVKEANMRAEEVAAKLRKIQCYYSTVIGNCSGDIPRNL